MIERIEKLMREAGMSFTSQTERIVSREEALKFAELIIRECANISNQAEKQCQHPGTEIKKHFGVKL